MAAYHVAAFYKFAPLANCHALRDPMLAGLKDLGACGSVLLADEGINGTLAASADKIQSALALIKTLTGIADIEHKLSFADTAPFKRMKVRLKREIVAIGIAAADPNVQVGTYVEASDWNTLIRDPSVVVIDTRNSYEVGIGTFAGALDPHTDRFGEFPAFVRQQLKIYKGTKVAMFCTGGIRCEKASSFMKSEGFENVYHLKGGILKYLEVIPQAESLWQGSCFVFDERVAVGHGLEVTDVSMCHGCLEPVTAIERQSPLFEDGVSCPKCAAALSETQKASSRERQKQFVLAQKRGTRHLGPTG